MEKKMNDGNSNESFFKRERSTNSSREERGSRDGGFSSGRREDGGARPERRSYNPNFTSDNRVKGSFERKEGGESRSFGGDRSSSPRREGGFERREGSSSPRHEGGFERREGGFQKREGGFQKREGGFERREGSSSPRREGGFERREGGFQKREGGFERREGGSSSPRREGGFERREGGFQKREGGFERREGGNSFQRREGGFERREGGSSFPRREGGFQKREGGFERREGGNSFPRREGGYQKREGGFDKKPMEAGFRRRDGGFQRHEDSYVKRDKSTAPQNSRFDNKYKEYDSDLQESFNVETELLKGDIRLNRYVSMSGVCSRREADSFIAAGRVAVNGEVVTELGSKVTVHDIITVDGKVIKGERNVYILMNKPKDFVTTLDDPNATNIVTELLGDHVKERVYPVGRLDKNSVGVLILTNDGELTKILTHPSYNKKKIYHVFIDKDISDEDMEKIASGIELEDGITFADEVSCVEGNRQEVGVEIHSGRNRIVRRMFEHLGYKVRKLDRVSFAGLTKKNLKRGEWRFLSGDEVAMLKSGVNLDK